MAWAERIRSHPKNQYGGSRQQRRLYQSVLEHELWYGLSKRDPAKARRVTQEMRDSNNRRLKTVSHTLAEHLASEA